MRWIAALLAVIVGTCLGLAYGWILNPVGVTSASPASLRIDYRTDYVLMVAETFGSTHDAGLARSQLAIFSGESPGALCADAVKQALTAHFASKDVAALEGLLQVMQSDNSLEAPGTPSP